MRACVCKRVRVWHGPGGWAEGKVLSPWVSHSAPPSLQHPVWLSRCSLGLSVPKIGGGLPEIRDLWQLSAAPQLSTSRARCLPAH